MVAIRRPKSTDAPAEMSTASRAGQPGAGPERRAQPSPTSRNLTGPHPPFDDAARLEKDAEGQFARPTASPNECGRVSAHPTVLSGDGDATVGAGHGRDRKE